ncbi:MAG: methyl-accepting chemotaxis protein [Candidatus Omnitrophota bacterium]|jgi:signal transduction histidine kinase
MNISKRRHYLVDKNMQFRYMAFVAVPLVLLMSGLYYLIYYSVFTQMLIPEAVATTLLPAMKKVNIVVAVFVPIAMFLLLRAALVYSNRIIGPIPRLERELDKVLAGDYSARIKTRDNDELKHFVDKVNLLVEKMEAKRI